MDRLQVLARHISQAACPSAESTLAAQLCAGSWSLPRFDVGNMEQFLDEHRDLKAEVYGKLEQHRELLLPTLEGISKGQWLEHAYSFVPSQSCAQKGGVSLAQLVKKAVLGRTSEYGTGHSKAMDQA